MSVIGKQAPKIPVRVVTVQEDDARLLPSEKRMRHILGPLFLANYPFGYISSETRRWSQVFSGLSSTELAERSAALFLRIDLARPASLTSSYFCLLFWSLIKLLPIGMLNAAGGATSSYFVEAGRKAVFWAVYRDGEKFAQFVVLAERIPTLGNNNILFFLVNTKCSLGHGLNLTTKHAWITKPNIRSNANMLINVEFKIKT